MCKTVIVCCLELVVPAGRASACLAQHRRDAFARWASMCDTGSPCVAHVDHPLHASAPRHSTLLASACPWGPNRTPPPLTSTPLFPCSLSILARRVSVLEAGCSMSTMASAMSAPCGWKVGRMLLKQAGTVPRRPRHQVAEDQRGLGTECQGAVGCHPLILQTTLVDSSGQWPKRTGCGNGRLVKRMDSRAGDCHCPGSLPGVTT